MESLGGKIGERVIRKDFLSEMRAFKSTHVFIEKFRKPCTCAGEDLHSEKTWEDSKLSPLAIIDAQGEQEVKVKSQSWMISPSTEGKAVCKNWEFSFFLSFFFLLFFPPGLQGNLWKH